MFKPVLQIKLMFLVFFLLSSSTQASVIERESFGLHTHFFTKGGAWPKVPFGFIRLWDSSVRWLDIEPINNQWDFSDLDAYVNKAQSENVKVLMTLGQTPRWAARDKSSKGVYGLGANSVPSSINEWRNYVITLANRYKGKITHWELWNEVNVSHFYTGSWEELVELEKVTSEVLKSIDSRNKLLTASIQGGAFGMFEKYLKAGGGQYADIISYHFYAPLDDPEIIPKRIEKIRSIMAKYGLNHKPLWNTEVGWLLKNVNGSLGRELRPTWSNWRQVSYQESPGFVIRNFLMNFYAGVEKVFWYSWDNGAMGLAEQRGHVLKPAAWGYKTATIWLVGSEFKGCLENKGIWFCRILKDSENSWIVWSVLEKESYFSIPVGWGVTHYMNSIGLSFLLDSSKVEIGSQPLLLYKIKNDVS